MSFSRKMLPPSAQNLFGLTDSHVTDCAGVKLHPEVAGPLQQMVDASVLAGFQLSVASGFRDFERQLFIWNNKAAGTRPILDSSGNPLNRDELTDTEAVFAILRWSALPGASRHHWGTDFDVIDAAALTPGYQVQLTVAETEGQGVFAAFHNWLQLYLGAQHDFFKPYAEDTGGVAVEPWHLSFAPVAREFQKAHSMALLRVQVEQAPLLLKEAVLANLEEIYHRFVEVDWRLYP